MQARKPATTMCAGEYSMRKLRLKFADACMLVWSAQSLVKAHAQDDDEACKYARDNAAHGAQLVLRAEDEEGDGDGSEGDEEGE